MGFYRFPAMAKLSELTNFKQVWKIIREIGEVDDAAYALAAARTIRRDDVENCRRLYGMELMDVIHEAETALRMEFSDEEVNELRDAVEEKNARRGYYGKEA